MTEDEIFAAAAALPAQEWAAYLDSACAGEPEVRARVEALLRSNDASGFMNQETGAAPDAVTLPIWENPPSEQSGDLIGRYKLLQQIGEGGFAVVWMAEQVEPVTRRVALKIIKAGMDTREVIARFEAERQALAMMDHPNIAKVFDAGATDKARPYFVMELVKGIPITQFCDEQRFTTRQRLKLFGNVCSAINHAHQKASFIATSSRRMSSSHSTATNRCRTLEILQEQEKMLLAQLQQLQGMLQYNRQLQAQIKADQTPPSSDAN